MRLRSVTMPSRVLWVNCERMLCKRYAPNRGPMKHAAKAVSSVRRSSSRAPLRASVVGASLACGVFVSASLRAESGRSGLGFLLPSLSSWMMSWKAGSVAWRYCRWRASWYHCLGRSAAGHCHQGADLPGSLGSFAQEPRRKQKHDQICGNSAAIWVCQCCKGWDNGYVDGVLMPPYRVVGSSQPVHVIVPARPQEVVGGRPERLLRVGEVGQQRAAAAERLWRV
jgi:hypothetical protein